MTYLKFKKTKSLSKTLIEKKAFLIVLGIFIAADAFAQNIPDSLLGIWEAKDRYIFFEEKEDEDPELVVLLKTYYGWYLDRAAEPEAYSDDEARSRNAATARKANSIKIQRVKTLC